MYYAKGISNVMIDINITGKNRWTNDAKASIGLISEKIKAGFTWGNIWLSHNFEAKCECFTWRSYRQKGTQKSLGGGFTDPVLVTIEPKQAPTIGSDLYADDDQEAETALSNFSLNQFFELEENFIHGLTVNFATYFFERHKITIIWSNDDVCYAGDLITVKNSVGDEAVIDLDDFRLIDCFTKRYPDNQMRWEKFCERHLKGLESNNTPIS